MPSIDPQGSSGESLEEAIPIHARSSADGVRQEYEWLATHIGQRGADFEMLSQALVERQGRTYDVLSIRLADGSEKQLYFDITAFFGKSDLLDQLLETEQ